MPDIPAGPDTRSRVLTAILSSPRPVTVEEIQEATGLHANTVRSHIALLLAAGSISREPADIAGRGRPRWLYRSARRVASPFQFLAEALTAQLANTEDPELAESAADRWANAIPALPVANSPDEAVDEAVGALNRLGFNAIASPVGDAIAVTACPYAAVVDEHPLICDIHAALVNRLLEQTGQDVTLASMVVWETPGMCVARLNRSDRRPARTITVSPAKPKPAKGPKK